jgi:hypothetical protein
LHVTAASLGGVSNLIARMSIALLLPFILGLPIAQSNQSLHHLLDRP